MSYDHNHRLGCLYIADTLQAKLLLRIGLGTLPQAEEYAIKLEIKLYIPYVELGKNGGTLAIKE